MNDRAAAHAVAGHSFEAALNPRPARTFVGAGLGLFALAAGLGIAITGNFPWSPVIFATGLVFHFWPALTGSRPALRFDRDGFWLDGLGLIPWEAVEKAAWRSKQGHPRAPAQAAALMQVELACPFSLAVVRPDPGPPWRGLQSRIWRRFGDTDLVIMFSGLQDPPGDVRDAFESFLGRPTGPRGIVA